MNLKKLGMVYAKCAAISSKNYMFPSKEYNKASTLDEKLNLYRKHTPSGFLFHYCPMNALRSIIENQQIRYTNIENLKDQTEFVHAIDLLKEVLDVNKAFFQHELFEYLNDEMVLTKLEERQQSYLVKGLNNSNDDLHLNYQDTLCNVYTFSLSETHDSEYMWGNYTGSATGACIEFLTLNNNIVKAYHESENYKMIYLWGRVLYDDDKKKEKIYELLQDIQEVYNLFIDDDLDIASKKNFVQSTLIRGMNNLRIFTKRKEDEKGKYFLEQEYRGVVIIPVCSIESGDLPANYTKGSHYIDIPFRPVAFNRLLISRRAKGGYEQWRNCIKEELEKHGMGQVEIYKY